MNRFVSAFAAVLTVTTVAAEAQEFPVTITHSFGETTIPAEPMRIVTLGWSAQDTVLALGKVPVAVPTNSYGGDDSGGFLPWTLEAVEALGGPTPELLSEAEPPIEAIAALQPDLILAPYSGLTEDQYAVLSGIAPVVASPGAPWSTSWQDVVLITGQALGQSAEAEALLAETEQFMVDEAAKYPELQGTTYATTIGYDGQVAVHSANDARVQMLADIGMVPDVEIEGADTSGGFYSVVSFENFDMIDADVIISFFDTQEAADAFYAQPTVELSPQVERGSVAAIVGEAKAMSIGALSPLGLRWGFPDYMADIAAVAAKAE
jgi:iron complex transport system substrate-binding protein